MKQSQWNRHFERILLSILCLLAVAILAVENRGSALFAIFDRFTIPQVFGAMCALAFIFIMARAHFNGTIDLSDLITEYAAGKRRITMSRFTAFGGFLIGSWAFVQATVTTKLDVSWEGILSFMAICFGYRVGDSWLKNQRDANAASAESGTTTTTTVAVEQVDTAKADAPKKKGGILS